MSTAPAEAASATLVWRPQTPGDSAFEAALFAAVTRQRLGLPEALLPQALIDAQFRSRCDTYVALHGGADRWILVLEGVPVGQLIVEERPDDLFIVDIALLPQVQGRRLGRQVMAQVQARARASGRPIAAHVAAGNLACQAMCRASGMTLEGPLGEAQLSIRWTAEGAA